MSWTVHSPWWLPGGHVQTIYAAKVARAQTHHRVRWERARWTTPDQDFIDLDWQRLYADSNTPLLVLFHGLEGSSQSHYAKAFAHVCRERQWNMVVVHFRGCSGEINRQPRAYHSGDSDEIEWILQRLKQQHTGSLFAVGISLGGNALMHWAGTRGAQAHRSVDKVASVCAPLDLTVCGHALGQGFNRWVYTRVFLATMKPKAIEKHQQFPGLFDVQRALKATTLHDFDDAFTAPLHGFEGVEDYWRKASAKPWLAHVEIPALVVNAQNDPFVPIQALPKPAEVSDAVTLWQPSQGGHVGFVQGAFPAHVLAMPRAVTHWLQQGNSHG